MLELDDLQHFLLVRPRAPVARYEFLTFRRPEAGAPGWRPWPIRWEPPRRFAPRHKTDMRWVTVAFTWNGLRALGVEEASLATFPEEFRQGMAARAEILGDTGANHPEHWVGGLASQELHAIIILFAVDREERARNVRAHQDFLARHPGTEVLYSLDLEAAMRPPFDYVHEHFGYRDRITAVPIEGLEEPSTPGSGPPTKPGEFLLGYPDETGGIGKMPQPEILSRNGSYLAYRQLQEHVGAFREFLRANAVTPEEQELLAAKLMGRWRSGAPLVLAPERDDPELATNDLRNDEFDYGKMDPFGYACPLGAHIRRMNPRDTAANVRQHRMIRRGGTFGPRLPDGAPEDGAERGIAAFVGCASLVRQFEFAQSVWANDPKFHEARQRARPLHRQPGRDL